MSLYELRMDPSTWPGEFTSFLKNQNISPDIYLNKPLKYFYCFPSNTSTVLSELPSAERLAWNENFFVLPSDSSIAHTEAFKKGKILPMDPSSWLAVHNLALRPGEHVLDLCCAPGTKLALISQSVCSTDTKGSVTGVDISKKRLASARTLMKKYQAPRVRLFCSDGRKFKTGIHDILTAQDSKALKFKDLYAELGEPFYSSTPYRRYPGCLLRQTYDKVLVDAQCTHDGSIKHVRKHIEAGWKDFDPDHYTSSGLAVLYDLQFALLENGFRLLRSDGILVYSTCSLTIEQNERIIERFISSYKDEAEIIDPIGPKEHITACCKDSKAMRMKPSDDTGGGFFLCRIKRVGNKR